jgi:hypothetical protein
MAHVSLHNLPQINLEACSDEDGITEAMLLLHTRDTLSPRDKELAKQLERPSPGKPQERRDRLDFKDPMKILFRKATLYSLSAPYFSLDATDAMCRPHVFIVTLGLFVDGGNGSVILAAAAIPWTATMMKLPAVQEFLEANAGKHTARFRLKEDRLKAWKKVLPALAERCREWSHGQRCEYTAPGATLPLSLNTWAPCLCRCGQGKLGSYTDGIKMPAK